MSLTIKTDEKKGGDVAETYTTKERLALTDFDADGNQRAVPEEHPEARWFYAIKGAEISLDDAIKYGLANAAKKKSDK